MLNKPICFISIIHAKDGILKDWGTEKWTTVSLTGKRSVTRAPSCHPAFLAGDSPGRIPCLELGRAGVKVVHKNKVSGKPREEQNDVAHTTLRDKEEDVTLLSPLS